MGDLCDPDDDNDGQLDEDEIFCGSNPKDAGSTSLDNDNDSILDVGDSDKDNDGIDDIVAVDDTDAVSCYALFFVPRSPRWLYLKNKYIS